MRPCPGLAPAGIPARLQVGCPATLCLSKWLRPSPAQASRVLWNSIESFRPGPFSSHSAGVSKHCQSTAKPLSGRDRPRAPQAGPGAGPAGLSRAARCHCRTAGSVLKGLKSFNPILLHSSYEPGPTRCVILKWVANFIAGQSHGLGTAPTRCRHRKRPGAALAARKPNISMLPASRSRGSATGSLPVNGRVRARVKYSLHHRQALAAAGFESVFGAQALPSAGPRSGHTYVYTHMHAYIHT